MPGDRFIELATSEGQRVLDALFRHASEAVTIQDRSGRLIYANDNAAQLVGFDTGEQMLTAPVSDIVGQFEMIDRSGEVMSIESLPGRRVMSGELYVEEVIGYRRKGSSRARWSRVHASPVKNDAGEVVFALNFFLDITSQMRNEETKELLGEVYETLGASLDTEQNLKALAHVLVPKVAGWCSVHLVDKESLILVAAAYPASKEAKALVTMRGEDTISLPSDRLPARVTASGRTEVIPSITEEMLARAEESEGPEFVDLIRRLQIHTVACIPLSFGGGVTGALTVARSRPDPDFDAGDIELLELIAARAATTLENARLYEQQHEIADTLQRGLIPRFLPTFPGLDFAARYRPLAAGVGHVGGDFYDVIARSPTQCVIMVGDIAGKGIAAAAAVGLARHTLRASAALDASPEVVFNQLNIALRDEDPERMCTLAYLLVERCDIGMQVKVALAGHPPPILLKPDGSTSQMGRPCPPAGVVPRLEPYVDQYEIHPGDIVVVYTDGFTLPDLAPPESVESALDGQSFANAEMALSHMLEVLGTGGAGSKDDIALVAMRLEY